MMHTAYIPMQRWLSTECVKNKLFTRIFIAVYSNGDVHLLLILSIVTLKGLKRYGTLIHACIVVCVGGREGGDRVREREEKGGGDKGGREGIGGGRGRRREGERERRRET